MKLLLVYPPFCTPTMMPYSISYLKGFVQKNSDIEVKCLDLNAKFHKIKFREHYNNLNGNYESTLTAFSNEARLTYSKNNKLVLNNEKPELFDDMLELIKNEKADIIAFSLVYNSQNFYTKALLDYLEKTCITGGPAVCEKVKEQTNFIANEIELLEKLNIEPKVFASVPDFSDYIDSDYLTKEIIYPIKSSTGCYYKQCTFCTHHNFSKYLELPIPKIKANNIFLIDDMIPVKRLKEILKSIRPKRAWTQLRPTKDLIPHMKELQKLGLKSVSWGVESGSNKVLKDMKKGTNANDIEAVLKASKEAGIINNVFVMFNFPTETEADYKLTIDFLKKNEQNIDLITTSTFGLQKASYIFNHPNEFGITKIIEKERTLLNEKIEYEPKPPKRNYKELEKLNKLPKVMNYLKEQTLFY